MRFSTEQKAVIDAEEDIVVVEGGPGSGKSLVLGEYAKKHISKKIIYLSRTRSNHDIVQNSFPKNVECFTISSLAFRKFGRDYADGISRGEVIKKGKIAYKWTNKNTLVWFSDILKDVNGKLPGYIDLYNIPYFKELVKEDTERKILESLCESLNIFTQDKRHNISLIDINSLMYYIKNSFTEKRFAGEKEVRDVLIFLMNKIWLEAQKLPTGDGNDNVSMTIDGYVKLYHLSKPDLKYDILIADDVQDFNYLLGDIVLNQKNVKNMVLAGDSNQQLYDWDGAINFLERVIENKDNLGEKKVGKYELNSSYRLSGSSSALTTLISQGIDGKDKIVTGLGVNGSSSFRTINPGLKYEEKEGIVFVDPEKYVDLDPYVDCAYLGKTNASLAKMGLNLNKKLKIPVNTKRITLDRDRHFTALKLLDMDFLLNEFTPEFLSENNFNLSFTNEKLFILAIEKIRILEKENNNPGFIKNIIDSGNYENNGKTISIVVCDYNSSSLDLDIFLNQIRAECFLQVVEIVARKGPYINLGIKYQSYLAEKLGKILENRGSEILYDEEKHEETFSYDKLKEFFNIIHKKNEFFYKDIFSFLHKNKKTDGLIMSTVHKAKGLEFDKVVYSKEIWKRIYRQLCDKKINKSSLSMLKEDFKVFLVAISRSKGEMIFEDDSDGHNFSMFLQKLSGIKDFKDFSSLLQKIEENEMINLTMLGMTGEAPEGELDSFFADHKKIDLKNNQQKQEKNSLKQEEIKKSKQKAKLFDDVNFNESDNDCNSVKNLSKNKRLFADIDLNGDFNVELESQKNKRKKLFDNIDNNDSIDINEKTVNEKNDPPSYTFGL